jgi:Predicted ATPase/kinase involved in NAD metabolism
MRLILALLLVGWFVTPVLANPYRFDERVPMKENPSWGDRGYRHMEWHHQYKRWHIRLVPTAARDSEHGDGDCRITSR